MSFGDHDGGDARANLWRGRSAVVLCIGREELTRQVNTDGCCEARERRHRQATHARSGY
jgi:hypothetical protein